MKLCMLALALLIAGCSPLPVFQEDPYRPSYEEIEHRALQETSPAARDSVRQAMLKERESKQKPWAFWALSTMFVGLTIYTTAILINDFE